MQRPVLCLRSGGRWRRGGGRDCGSRCASLDCFGVCDGAVSVAFIGVGWSWDAIDGDRSKKKVAVEMGYPQKSILSLPFQFSSKVKSDSEDVLDIDFQANTSSPTGTCMLHAGCGCLPSMSLMLVHQSMNVCSQVLMQSARDKAVLRYPVGRCGAYEAILTTGFYCVSSSLIQSKNTQLLYIHLYP